MAGPSGVVSQPRHLRVAPAKRGTLRHAPAVSLSSPPHLDGPEAARAAHLRYVSDTQPGITRRRAGKHFSYRGPDGRPIRDPATLQRIRAWPSRPRGPTSGSARSPNGHIQATGRDAQGRKQYRYHPSAGGRCATRPSSTGCWRSARRCRRSASGSTATWPARPAAREGAGRGGAAAGDDADPRRQRGVRPAEPAPTA